MKPKFTLLLLCLSLTTLAAAQSVDRADILRRGDRVQHVVPADAFAQVVASDPLAPPADDSHKWFVTLLSQPGCRPCQTLLRDLNSSDELRAFADPSDPRRSWAHFNRYSSADESQTWRWRNIAIAGYPTLLIQTPLDGRYGPPGTVVLQKTGYDGDAKSLAAQFRTAIESHARKFAPQVSTHEASGADETTFVAAHAAPRATPPFAPPALPDALPTPLFPLPLLPTVVPPGIDPDAKPAPEKTPDIAKTPNDGVRPQEVKPGTNPVVGPTPDNAKIPQHPEAVVIVDKFADDVSDEGVMQRFRGVLQKLRGERPGLIVRILDIRDALQYPVTRDELPALVTTNEGRVDTKFDRTLLPLLGQTPTFPWDALVGMLASGFNWIGAAAIGLWAIRTVRAYRKARGQTLLLDDATLSRLRDALGIKP